MQSFEKFYHRLTLKQKCLKKINDNNIKIVNKSLLLSELDQRVIEVMQNKSLMNEEIKLDEIEHETCRICLTCTPQGMSNLFEDANYDNHVSVVDKISTCSCVTVSISKRTGKHLLFLLLFRF